MSCVSQNQPLQGTCLTAAVNCVKKNMFFFPGESETKKTSAMSHTAMGKPIRWGCTSGKRERFSASYFDLASLGWCGMFHYESPIIDLGG